MATYVKIVDGPGRSDLQNALFASGTRVTFALEGHGGKSQPHTVRVCQVGRQDEMSVDWRVIVQFMDGRSHLFLPHLKQWPLRPISLYYNGVKREGYAVFPDPREDMVLPQEGDAAWSFYHGTHYEGVLTAVRLFSARQPQPHFVAKLIPRNGRTWGYHSDYPGIGVGYDKPITWDDAARMWHAPADHD